jgi:hypothetical protein
MTWRQADLFAPSDAARLALGDDRDTRILVISHSCDLARPADKEPEVELIVGRRVDVADGRSSKGHSIRKLHLPLKDAQGALIEWVELDLSHKRVIQKIQLPVLPWDERRVSPRDCGVLRRWLAQRYDRAAFPDSFVRAMADVRLDKQLEKIATRYGTSLIGFYFDIEDETATDPGSPIVVDVVLAYEADDLDTAQRTEDADNAQLAEQAAEEIKQAFHAKCYVSGCWQGLELRSCKHISDEVLPLSVARQMRRWRFEYLSLDGQSIDDSE